MSLSMIQKPKPVAPIITLVGTPGVGKTTLAALFPNPVFIQAEEITGVFDDWDDEKKPDSFPVLKRETGVGTRTCWSAKLYDGAGNACIQQRKARMSRF
jgi:CO dehydrogenase nickel-insertion accessory protein CooC1